MPLRRWGGSGFRDGWRHYRFGQRVRVDAARDATGVTDDVGAVGLAGCVAAGWRFVGADCRRSTSYAGRAHGKPGLLDRWRYDCFENGVRGDAARDTTGVSNDVGTLDWEGSATTSR